MFRRRSSRIVWSAPRHELDPSPGRSPTTLAPIGGNEVLAQASAADEGPGGLVGQTLAVDLRRAIAEEGLPTIPGLSPEEELCELLRAAAEIEHGLMVLYLYAAYTCIDPLIAGIVSSIAVEEMGHLISVQNLLLAAGARPHLGRYDESPHDFDPFPFVREPMGRGALAKYTACEMPGADGMSEAQRQRVPAIVDAARVAAGGMTPHRVGLLYLKIYWLLRDSDEPLRNPQLEPWPDCPVEELAAIPALRGRHVGTFPRRDTIEAQAKAADWQRNQASMKVLTVESQSQALDAVAQISAQGEGFASETESHFDRFMRAYELAVPGGVVGGDFPVDPWYDGGGEPSAQITAAGARELSRLSDWLYETLLLSIALAVHPDVERDATQRRGAAAACLDLMADVFRPLPADFRSLRIRDEAGSPRLPLCFTLPKAGLDDPSVLADRLHARIDAAIELARSLEAPDSIAQPLEPTAEWIRSFLEERRAALEGIA